MCNGFCRRKNTEIGYYRFCNTLQSIVGFDDGEPTRWCYYANPYAQIPRDHGRSTGLQPYFCDDYAPWKVTLVALRIPPRVGVPCHDNVHDQPGHLPNSRSVNKRLGPSTKVIDTIGNLARIHRRDESGGELKG